MTNFYNLDLSKMIWTRPKQIGPVQNNWYSTKMIWMVQNHFGPIEGLSYCKELMWSNHQTTTLVFPNFFIDFFSVLICNIRFIILTFFLLSFGKKVWKMTREMPSEYSKTCKKRTWFVMPLEIQLNPLFKDSISITCIQVQR